MRYWNAPQLLSPHERRSLDREYDSATGGLLYVNKIFEVYILEVNVHWLWYALRVLGSLSYTEV